jgi:hypothetical protein
MKILSHLDYKALASRIEGKVGKIKSKVIHKDFLKNLDYIAKHNAYSTWKHSDICNLNICKLVIISNQKNMDSLKHCFLPLFFIL